MIYSMLTVNQITDMFSSHACMLQLTLQLAPGKHSGELFIVNLFLKS